ncbi:hypothetical protein BO221_15770 [Archangium sp. Cb G35]|uniref:ester cyclase n=1 Tax=Archangium sp. Cb G35 TaxID=1920190 RepID=UPI00093649B9|nr:ester cyclase [Archangium sp. Cb G35]OJT24599.1 hypothetical protein BO221_15770 [Archangium sp. Cb G35]
MDATTARQFYQDYVDTIYHERKVEELGRFFAESLVPHPALPAGLEPGLKGMKVVVASWMQAFTSIRFTIDSFVFQNDIIAPRLTISAVHSGDFMGIQASGQRVNLIVHPHYRIENHKIAEFWDLPDMLTLLQQIGPSRSHNNSLETVADRWEPSLRAA